MEERRRIRLKILVPLNHREDIKSYRAAGADELYLGFYDERWTEHFGHFADINRMSGFEKHANQYSFLEVIDIIQEIRAEHMDAFVTMNANVYNDEALKWIEGNYFPILLAAGVSGVIVSTEKIARLAMHNGLQPIASTMMGLYNSDIIRYYQAIGIQRVIVPRDLSLKEIAMIREQLPTVDLEVFFMRNGCVFSDSHCLGTHRKECGATCGSLKSFNKRIYTDAQDFRSKHAVELNDILYHNYFHHDACGMCALYRMQEIGVTALKIVGRADNPSSVAEDIRLTKENMRIVSSSRNEEEYLERMILPKNAYSQCKLGLSCYYPEVRFGTT